TLTNISMTLSELNELPVARVTELFTACCGSATWVSHMVARRPFVSRDELLVSADHVWDGLARDDWLEAFRHHPRIGESAAAVAQGEQARQWSAGEQVAVRRAADSIRLAQQDM